MMWLFVPGKIADYMDKIMDVKYIGFSPFKFVNCKKRHTLPDLILVLGGIEVKISAWAYIAETGDDDEDAWASCISLLDGSRDDVLFLGAAFLRGVRMVVDVQNETIGCK